MSAELPVSAPARLRSLLAGTADNALKIVHRGPHAVYVALPSADNRCVGVLGSAATAVPCGLRLATPTVGPLTGERAEVRAGVLHVDGVALPVRRVVDATVPAMPRVLDGGDPLRGIDATVAGELTALRLDPQHLDRVLGHGGGLTPLGDDVICGWLAQHRSLGVATPWADDVVRIARTRTTTLSATLLECAFHGEVIPEFAAWVAAHETDEPARAAELASVGHSSGAGLLYGARAALLHLSRKAAA
ncbi:DUF2877 domain-containing protein [Nocardioides sp. LHG3406-4]|uniref:oxamate carbamoyltransferase subunit AllH family protein n=1 Tax=Nocardioides sp. LHG3406-4 TaxID=2804575 RepID=UPI003CF8073F